MKIHLVSDLHADFSDYDITFPECDLVVIAGDVAESIWHLEQILDRNRSSKRIAFVPGNHDFYGSSIFEKEKSFKELEYKFSNFIFLQYDWIVIDDVAIFGTTLWSDLNSYKNPVWQFQLKNWYPMTISDCRQINGWSSDLMISEYNSAILALKLFLDECKDHKKIIVTHFAPSLRSVHEIFKDQVPFNSYWCNDVPSELIDQVSLWMHGHVHNSFDYDIGNCRVVCNPRGYVHPRYGVENEKFNPNLIIEI